MSTVWTCHELAGCSRASKVPTAGYYRVADALGYLVSDQGVQPVESCWKLGLFHAADGARIVGAEAALKALKGPILRCIRQMQTKHKPNRNCRFGVSDPPGYDMA